MLGQRSWFGWVQRGTGTGGALRAHAAKAGRVCSSVPQLTVTPSLSLIRRGKDALPLAALSPALSFCLRGFCCKPQECVSGKEGFWGVLITPLYKFGITMQRANLEEAIQEGSQWTATEPHVSVCRACNLWESSPLTILICVLHKHLLS